MSRQASAQSMLVNMNSNVFSCIQLPENFGHVSLEDLTGRYEEALIDLSRAHVNAVTVGPLGNVSPTNAAPFPPRPIMPNNSAGQRGARQVCAFLHDHLLYLKMLIEEINQLQEILHPELGGFDTEEIDIYHLVGFDSSLPPRLNPLAAYFLRAVVRWRMSQVDFQITSHFIEEVFEVIDQVRRGIRAPAVVDASRIDANELSTQLKAWQSLYLEINLDFFALSSGFTKRTLFYRDQQGLREFKRMLIGGRNP